MTDKHDSLLYLKRFLAIEKMIEDLTHELKERLLDIFAKYPDLQTYHLRSGEIVLVSKLAINDAHYMATRSYCGCVQAMPYANWMPGNIRIYVSPMSVTLGCNSDYEGGECFTGIAVRDGWKDKAKEYGYNDRVIKEMQAYLDKHPYKEVKCWDDEEEE